MRKGMKKGMVKMGKKMEKRFKQMEVVLKEEIETQLTKGIDVGMKEMDDRTAKKRAELAEKLS